jgi:hypothetical protein
MATTTIDLGSQAGGVVNMCSAVVTGDGNDQVLRLGFVGRSAKIIIGADFYELIAHYPKTGAATVKIYKNRVADATGDVVFALEDSGKSTVVIKVAALAAAATALVMVWGS